jgi:glycerophosphoryl diester phosphodiesterase
VAFFVSKFMINQLVLIILSFALFAKGQESIRHREKESGQYYQPMICGHRGGFYNDYPENSFGAFDFTVSHASRLPIIIEFDIRKSKQGTLFIMHDSTIDRTTNGRGKIDQQTDDYISSLFLIDSQGKVTDERIPKFEEILDYAAKRDILLMLDIKDDVWEDALALVSKKNMGSKCIVLTFTAKNTRTAYKYLSNAKISYLDTDLEDRIEASKIPKSNRIAYISDKTSQERIAELSNDGEVLMADANEHNKNNGNPFQNSYYQKSVKSQNLNVLITDFPVFVSQIFYQRLDR